MHQATIPPYRDKNLEHRPGEVWEDIPELDGLYLISNFGRILRKKRIIYDSLNRPRTFPEAIILPQINKDKNMLKKDWTKRLQVTVHVDKTVYHFQINRLVYNIFVKEFDINNPYLVVSAKNGNGLDVYPENLELITYELKNQKPYNTGRQLSHFQTNKLKLIQANMASKATNSILISRYDHKGFLIDTFKSIAEAAEQTGIAYSNIASASKSLCRKTGGYYWRRGNANKINWKEVNTANHKRKLSFQEKRGVKVTQFDIAGNPIAVYTTKSEAARKIGVSHRGISKNIQGKSKSAGGYVWKEGDFMSKDKPVQ